MTKIHKVAMKRILVEKLRIVEHTQKDSREAGTFTGVLHWEKDLGKVYIEAGNFQPTGATIPRQMLKMDECVSGEPCCLFFETNN